MSGTTWSIKELWQKPPPCHEETLRTTLPQQSSSSPLAVSSNATRRLRLSSTETHWLSSSLDVLRYQKRQWGFESGRHRVARTVGNIGGIRNFHQTNCSAGNERERPKDVWNVHARRRRWMHLPAVPDGTRSSMVWLSWKNGCQTVMQEVKLLSGRQEILKGMIEDENQVAEQSNGKVLRKDFLRRWRSWKKRNQKRRCHLCRKSTPSGDVRMKEIKQESCKDLEAPEGPREALHWY